MTITIPGVVYVNGDTAWGHVSRGGKLNLVSKDLVFYSVPRPENMQPSDIYIDADVKCWTWLVLS